MYFNYNNLEYKFHIYIFFIYYYILYIYIFFYIFYIYIEKKKNICSFRTFVFKYQNQV